jgi:hypothetical protein
LVAALAPAVPVGGEALQRGGDLAELALGAGQQDRGLSAFEGSGRSLGIVLVVDIASRPSRRRRVKISLHRRDQAGCLGALPGQVLVRYLVVHPIILRQRGRRARSDLPARRQVVEADQPARVLVHQHVGITFLASRRNSYTTGANVNVDGGSAFYA